MWVSVVSHLSVTALGCCWSSLMLWIVLHNSCHLSPLLPSHTHTHTHTNQSPLMCYFIFLLFSLTHTHTSKPFPVSFYFSPLFTHTHTHTHTNTHIKTHSFVHPVMAWCGCSVVCGIGGVGGQDGSNTEVTVPWAVGVSWLSQLVCWRSLL